MIQVELKEGIHVHEYHVHDFLSENAMAICHVDLIFSPYGQTDRFL
jgi:hypothetical protein